MAPENFIEVSFEVCNKVGGIYQVLKSKAEKMREYYGENYIVVGFYNEENAREDFGPRELEQPFEDAFTRVESQGVTCYYGSWRVKGSPKCILVDASGLEKDVDDIKQEMWENQGIDSINAGSEFDEPVKWSYAVGQVINELEDRLEGETVVQLHEWLSGPAMFQFDSPTVFTTHATVLGRALSNSDYDLEEKVEYGDIDESLAEDYGVKSKHQVEKASAESAEVFTTVSDNTAEEAKAIHGVEVDKVLPNGFNVKDFPSLEDLSYQHKEKKQEMKEFIQAYFEPYYDVDIDNDPRILFTSGRYEFHNKGLDVFIESLAEVNERDGEDFFVFIFVPSDVGDIKSDVMENMALHQELEDYVESVMPEVKSTLLNSLASQEDPGENLKKLIEETSADHKSLQRSFHARREQKPPLTPFHLNYLHDEVIEKLQEEGLNNTEDDRVKVVFYPTYLSRGDQLLSMNYNDAVVASTAGIFPSYYEPWGYTPVETAANGALAVTTDMAGFGKFLQNKTDKNERTGIQVLERRDTPIDQTVSDLADMIDNIINYSKTEITERKHNARRLAQLTSWEKLGENYREAHEMAVGEQ